MNQTNVTQMHYARQGILTDQMRYVAQQEGMDPQSIREEIAAGRCIIPANIHHLRKGLKPIGIGVALRCKINANIGTSTSTSDLDQELCKLQIALRFGSDSLMDLSTGGDLDRIRQAIIDNSPAPVGTVPVYHMATLVDNIAELSPSEMLELIERQARQGVDFMTIHAGLLLEHLPLVKDRLTRIVSRGGALMVEWMTKRAQQNPFYTHFDQICEIFKRYDVSFSLGDGLRPGCIADASDPAQFAELDTLGELTLKAWSHDVQVMIEGPGHLPMDQIEMNVQRAAQVCHGAPFYVLGPLVTDIAPGYDHITSAIGAAMAGYYGASMLCYVTPSEHLGLPGKQEVKEGVIAYRIAAHAADLARRRRGAREWDDRLSKARFGFDWDQQFDLAIDPQKARQIYQHTLTTKGDNPDFCTMCGPKFCPMRSSKKQEY